MTTLAWQTAAGLADSIRTRALSATELMRATLARIDAVNPRVNAVVNLLPAEAALKLARDADQALARGLRPGPLHGLPVAVKDLVDVRGFPTTLGFPPLAHNVAGHDAPMVARLRAAGALIIGKTNTPEFGLGSHTFNAVFGATRNPYAPERTAGGSSGGAAAALATGLFAIADGSDMGGSLRNPASFCNVVGFRPTVGRVPDERPFGWFGRISTLGPMARTVADAALLLAVQTGQYAHDALDRRDPIALPIRGNDLTTRAAHHPGRVRIALAEDLGGLPVHADVRAIIRQAARVFEALGCEVTPACPDLGGAMEVFQVQRAAALAVLGRTLDASVPDWRAHAKDTAIWNIDRGLALTADEIIRSEVERTRIYRGVVEFFDAYDVLLCPAAQVPPFEATREWVDEIEGVALATYIDWMTVCCAISVTTCPAVSVPAGFTAGGLPVGVQLVAAPRADLHLLQIARIFEAATRHHEVHPALAP